MDSMIPGKVTLWANSGCPFARRAMITCMEKDIVGPLVEHITIPLSGHIKILEQGGLDAYPDATEIWPGKSVADITQIKEDYKRDVNPTGEVPTLQISGETVFEADVISEFLEDRFPHQGTSLMPVNPVARAKVRHLIKLMNGPTMVSAMYGCLMNQDPSKDSAIRDKLYKGLQSFVQLSSDGGPYFLGAEFSLADVLLMPMYDQFRFTLPHYRGVEFIPQNTTEYPWAAKLNSWAAAVQERESFVGFSRGEEYYIKAYAGYAGARGVATFGA